MAITASATATTNFEPIPEGVHIANCIAIIDIGTQKVTWQGVEKQQPKIMITWEIPSEKVTIDGEEKPRVISKEYTRSLSDKAILRAHLEAWRGKKFNDEELRGFDLMRVLGTTCQLQILHVTKGDRTYANIGSIMALPKGTPKPDIISDKIYFDLSDSACLSLFEKIPEWIRDKIKLSIEYLRLTDTQIDDSNTEEFAEIDDDGDLPF